VYKKLKTVHNLLVTAHFLDCSCDWNTPPMWYVLCPVCVACAVGRVSAGEHIGVELDGVRIEDLHRLKTAETFRFGSTDTKPLQLLFISHYIYNVLHRQTFPFNYNYTTKF